MRKFETEPPTNGTVMIDKVNEAESSEVPKPIVMQKKANPKSPYTIDGILVIVVIVVRKSAESQVGLAYSLRKTPMRTPTGTEKTATNDINKSDPTMAGKIPPCVMPWLGNSVKKVGLK